MLLVPCDKGIFVDGVNHDQSGSWCLLSSFSSSDIHQLAKIEISFPLQSRYRLFSIVLSSCFSAAVVALPRAEPANTAFRRCCARRRTSSSSSRARGMRRCNGSGKRYGRESAGALSSRDGIVFAAGKILVPSILLSIKRIRNYLAFWI